MNSGPFPVFHAVFMAEASLIAMASLEAWLASGNAVEAIWSSHPQRWKKFRAALACQGISVLPLPDLKRVQPAGTADVLIAVMSNAIVPDRLTAMFNNRAVNLHPAILPNCKGRAPRQAMLSDGTEKSDGGVTAHVITRELDGGPIIGKRHVPCTPADDWWSWDRNLAIAAAGLFANEIRLYLSGVHASEPQLPGEGNYRMVRAGEFAITPSRSVGEVRSLLAHLRRYPVRVLEGSEPGGRFVATVETFRKVLGPPTGQPARRLHGGVEIDLIDARVRLDGPGRLLRLYRRWRERGVLKLARSIGARTPGQRENRHGNAN